MAIYAARGPGLAASGHQPVAMVGEAPAYGVGEWLNPPGWSPQPFWLHRRMADGTVKGVIVEIQPAAYVRSGTGRNGKRVAARGVLARVRQIPRTVTPASAAHERRLRSEGSIPAREMPAEVIDMVIDAYGAGDLPPEIAELCRARIRDRERAEREKAKPAREESAPSKAPKARAGRAPTGNAKARRKTS